MYSRTPETGALLVTARAGSIIGIGLSLDAGANVNHATPDGITALHNASTGGHVDAVNFLLIHGANPLAKNQANQLPSDIAGNPEVRVLLQTAIASIANNNKTAAYVINNAVTAKVALAPAPADSIVR